MNKIYTKNVSEDPWLFDQTHDTKEWMEDRARLAHVLGYDTYIDDDTLFVVDNDMLNRIYFTEDYKEFDYDVRSEI
jgi:hypothetical protein